MHDFFALLGAYQVYGWTAFVLALLVTPVAMRIARRTGIMDYPDAVLKPHAKPTPYMGGVAVCLGWAAALALGLVRGLDASVLLPLLLGGVAMSILGLVDDARGVSPKLRLVVGSIVISAVLLGGQIGFRLVDSLLGPIGLVLPAWLSLPCSLLIGVIVVLGACNSTNLIDGLDGLCSGVTGIISLGFFLLASHLALFGYSREGDPVRLVVAISMFGAALGFLPWNFNPARIFLGDAGSVLLGFNCGMLIVLFAEHAIARWVVGSLMIFSVPVFDTLLAMVRRWRSGRSIFEGDRSHFYDQLVQRGFTVRQTVLISYGLTVFYGAMGLLMTWVRPGGRPVIRTRYAIPLYLLVCLLTALVAHLTGLTRPEERRTGLLAREARQTHA